MRRSSRTFLFALLALDLVFADASSRVSQPWLIAPSFREKYATAVRLFHARGFQERHALPSGWMSPYSAYIVSTLSEFQRSLHLVGTVGEIGVYHGLFFIALAMTAVDGETLFACDKWGDSYTHLGFVKRNCFFKNLKAYGVNTTNVHIFEDSSKLRAETIESAALTPVRLFSIDGDHSRDATLSDLRLAEAVLANGGVVVLDDYRNKFQPGVAEALQIYCEQVNFALVPFLLVAGKLYLTFVPQHTRYVAWAWKDPVLLSLDMVNSTLCGVQISVVDAACCDDQRYLNQSGLPTLWDAWWYTLQ